MNKFNLGIDIGGTNIKYCATDNQGNIIFRDEQPTENTSCELLISQIINICENMKKKYFLKKIGIGVPGSVIGGIVDTDNLPLKNINFSDIIESKINFPVLVANDADCAVLAESIYGVGKEYKNMVLITLGTGIGSGIIIDGKIYHGHGMAGELGHMCLDIDGRECNCGKRGCFEKYASASALMDSAEKVLFENKDSILYKLYSQNNSIINGKVFFSALRKNCNVTAKLFEMYIHYLSMGINSIINILDPDIIILSGGITNAGNILTDKINNELNCKTPIVISNLKNDAGMLGASLL